jgi:hypothetical protein
MKVVKTIFTATALIVVCSGAALAEDYRYDQVTRVCPSSGEAQCYGTDAQDFIMGTLAVDVIFGKAGDDDIDTEGWEGPFKQPTTIRPPTPHRGRCRTRVASLPQPRDRRVSRALLAPVVLVLRGRG